jgi:plasmid stability protein
MAKSSESITVRGLEAGTKQKLRVRAAERGHSMEEEVRSLIRKAVDERTDDGEDLGTAIHRRFARYGGVNLDLPPRGPDREPPSFDE